MRTTVFIDGGWIEGKWIEGKWMNDEMSHTEETDGVGRGVILFTREETYGNRIKKVSCINETQPYYLNRRTEERSNTLGTLGSFIES